MKLSTKARYGLRAMMDVAAHSASSAMQLKHVAARQGLSVKYLEQIFAQLKAAGLVRGIRGPRGGYVLARSPETITVQEVVEALEGSLSLVDCVEDESVCDRSPVCPAREVWARVSAQLKDELARISLAQVGMRMAGDQAPLEANYSI